MGPFGFRPSRREGPGLTGDVYYPLRPVRRGFLVFTRKSEEGGNQLSKNREIKQQVVADIAEKFKAAKSVVIVDFKGLTVEEITALRAKFRAGEVDYVVLKNTLVRSALAELGIVGLDVVLVGPSAFAFSTRDAVSGAKIIKEYMENDKRETMKVKAGYMDGVVLDVQGVRVLADLPPKEVLIARMMGSLNAPITNFVGVLSATLRSLVYALDAVRKQKGGEA
jgi:large subunit ribosomal protein L10